MKKEPTLISKPDIMTCWRCEGKKVIFSRIKNKIGIKQQSLKTCPLCNGTGKWIENHYIVIDNKNKIAFDTDTGG